MAKKVKKLTLKNSQGFSLLEVLIALTLFAVFAAVYATSQGLILTDSTLMKENIILKDLCLEKINEAIINPPEFEDSITLQAETKVFENNPEFQYTIRYEKFKIPDIAKLTGEDENEDGNYSDNKEQLFQKKIMESIKENMELLIWQLEVTVVNSVTSNSFTLSTWLLNNEAQVKISPI